MLLTKQSSASKNLRKLPILIPAVGASAAFAAALDAQLGAGAVEWLIDICLSNPETSMAAPTMPMKHGEHVPLYAGIGSGLASVAFIAGWWQCRGIDSSGQATTREGELALIAALAVLANATRGCGPEEIQSSHAKVSQRDLGLEQAVIALDYFTPEALIDDINLFGELSNPNDRRMVICGAIEFARLVPGCNDLDETLVAIAGAMRMSGAEIEEHWDARVRDKSVRLEAPTSTERLRAAMGRLGEIAADATRRYAPQPSIAGPAAT